MKHRLRFAAICILLAPIARADVIVVDPHGGPGAALLQSALDAAQPGDVVLLFAGDYSSATPLQLDGKGLTLVANEAGLELSCLVATHLPVGQTLLLRGLRVIAPPHALQGFVIDGDSTVWVEDCVGVGNDGWLDTNGDAQFAGTGLFSVGKGEIVVARSQFVGGRGLDATVGPGGEPVPAWFGSIGLGISGLRTAALFDVVATGGRGGDGPTNVDLGSDGHAGLALTSSTGVLQGGTYTGGDEGENNPATTSSGPGLQLGFAVAHIRGATFVPGAVNGVGTVAPPISNLVSVVTTEPAAPRLLAIDSPVREFGTAGVHVAASPGDVAWLFVSTAPGGPWLPKKQGVCAINPAMPVLPVYLGAVDASGQLELGAVLPTLPPGTDSAVLFAQLAVVDAQGVVLLGTASSIVWISASF
jgi:hypothetical protein